MPIEYRFDDLDLREEPASEKSFDTGTDSEVSARCSLQVGCNTRNTCTTFYC